MSNDLTEEQREARRARARDLIEERLTETWHATAPATPKHSSCSEPCACVTASGRKRPRRPPVAEAHDQTYIDALGADLAQQNLNALVLAENGDNQLGGPHPNHPGWRIWNGNLIRVGHHNPRHFALEADAILPGRMYADRAHHWHAHLTNGTWTTCPPHADGAIPLTIAITQTRDD